MPQQPLRADQLLLHRGMAASRSQAQRLIAAGLRWRVGAGPWQQVGKNGQLLPPDAELQLQDASEAAFVSRGGLKLQGALAATGLSAAGKVCLDVGQSTGGFSDYLLQAGAAHVLGVDVGHGQLHPKLRADARITALEGINARELSPALLHSAQQAAAVAQPLLSFELIVGDLSFISLRHILPCLRPLLRPSGDVLLLVKPQFELQPADIGKGGLVRDASKYAEVEASLRQACAEAQFSVCAWLDSPIHGGDGNREFFIWVQPC